MKLRDTLYKLYCSARRIIAPKLRYSQELYEDVLKLNVKHDTVWLDLGCGRHLLPAWRSAEERLLVKSCQMIVGLDYDLSSLRDHQNISLKVRGSIEELPFKGDHFDLLTANMVVEHLETPDVQFREASRILKCGGVFIFHTPNAFGYPTIASRLMPEALKGKLIHFLEERKAEDVFETHYKANTVKRIHALARSNGFEMLKIHMVVTDALFEMVLPIAIAELIWIRLLMTRPFRPLRATIIAVLRKQS
jgi:ubiquinone/menaquinone biosynthesis C-methylase UbiE